MNDTLERLRKKALRRDSLGGWFVGRLTVEEMRALLDIAEAAPCRRFTMIPCRERPEIPPDDYCAVCKGFASLDSTGGAER